MRLVHYLPRIRMLDGGIVRAVLDNAEIMSANEEWSVTIAYHDAPDLDEVAERLRQHGVELRQVAGASSGLRRLPPSTVDEIMDAARDGVVHLHHVWSPQAAQLAAAAQRRDVRYVLSVHGTLDDWSMRQSSLRKHLFLRAISRRMFRHAAAALCTAQAERDQAAQRVPVARWQVLPYLFNPPAGVPDDDALPIPFWSDTGTPRLVFLSRIHKKKRPELFLEVVARLRSRGQDVQAVVMGSPAPDDVEFERLVHQRCTALGLDDAVKFVGHVNDPERSTALRHADVMLVATHQENFGFVFVEALANGCPVVATRGTDIWQELERCEAVRVVDEGRAVDHESFVDSLADACVELLPVGPATRASARSFVREWLDPNRIGRAYAEIYSGAPGRPGSA
jgi:glycosyltransferase involved in cell wall biosynthesis